MFKGKKLKLNTKIVGATMVTIFSLAAAFSGTIAWFETTKSVSVQAGAFQVVNNSSAEMGPVKLVKFEYQVLDTFIDYINTDQGSVETYSFNSSNQTFENVDNESAFATTDVMNVFDPAGYEISSNIRDQYCNVVYIITVSGSSLSNLKVYANIIPPQAQEDASSSSSTNYMNYEYVPLSDYVDFDVYDDSDLEDADDNYDIENNPEYYYPSHLKNLVTPYIMNESRNEKVFYQVDFLSSQEGKQHAHFYGTNPKTNKLLLRNNFNVEGNTATLYVNVNYSPEQLDKYADSLVDLTVIAQYDFYLSIEL